MGHKLLKAITKQQQNPYNWTSSSTYLESCVQTFSFDVFSLWCQQLSCQHTLFTNVLTLQHVLRVSYCPPVWAPTLALYLAALWVYGIIMVTIYWNISFWWTKGSWIHEYYRFGSGLAIRICNVFTRGFIYM